MAVTAEQMSGSRTVAAAKRAVLKPTRAAKPLQLEQIDQLLGAIYDGATESPPWQTAMARLREVLAAAHVTLMLRPPSSDSAGVMINTGPTTEIGRATSELQSLMRISYAVFCLKKKKNNKQK